jgi:predicted TIM-barrel fold metal-dependent hydrolase
MLRRVLFCALAVALSSCAQRTASHVGELKQTSDAPLVDYHQHLMSPAAAKAASDPPLAVVKLPPDLDSLLTARIQSSTDEKKLAALYTKDTWLLQSFDPGYVRGGDAVASWWAGNTNEPYHLAPVGYGVTGSSGQISAYLLDHATDSEPAAHVLLSVGKNAEGRWRITSEALTMGGPYTRRPVSADQLIALLDTAGIQRALVLSVAYQWGALDRSATDEYAKVREENDWVAAQVARYPDRLRAFCSFNPLKPYALEELDRCAKSGSFRGIKLHAGNSDVDWTNAQHVESMRRVFQAANERGLAIVIHMAPRGSKYGRGAGQTFLDKVLPAAPDIPIQIAHMGSPGHLDVKSDSALGPIAEAVAAGDPRTKNLWFDVATVAYPGLTAARAKVVAARIRQLGVRRVLYGTDMAGDGNLPPVDSWALFRRRVPLTDEEFRVIAGNVAPYMR